MKAMINQEELVEMKATPAGRALWHYLHRRVTELKEQWAEGRFNSENPNVCTAANTSAVTALRTLQEIIDIDADELNEEERSEGREQLGISTSRKGRAA